MKQIKAICFDFWGTLVEAGGHKQINDLKKILGWKKYFKKFFLSSDLGVLKPDIKILKAVEQYLNIPKQNILMVDDSLYHGVIPAKNFGWQTTTSTLRVARWLL